MNRTSFLTLIVSLFSVSGFAIDMPGGIVQVAAPSKELYEFVLTPSYVMAPNGAYLSADMRANPNDDFGTGFSFGAGETGFHLGGHATWHAIPDTQSQPGLSVVGGLYVSTHRPTNATYFVVKLAPVLSKTVQLNWGTMTPYTAVNIAPSFRLGLPQNEISVKGSFGVMSALKVLAGVKLWTEVDIALWNSVHEVVIGASYPFDAI